MGVVTHWSRRYVKSGVITAKQSSKKVNALLEYFPLFKFYRQNSFSINFHLKRAAIQRPENQ